MILLQKYMFFNIYFYHFNNILTSQIYLGRSRYEVLTPKLGTTCFNLIKKTTTKKQMFCAWEKHEVQSE